MTDSTLHYFMYFRKTDETKRNMVNTLILRRVASCTHNLDKLRANGSAIASTLVFVFFFVVVFRFAIWSSTHRTHRIRIIILYFAIQTEKAAICKRLTIRMYQ